jgi:hypothetical protein
VDQLFATTDCTLCRGVWNDRCELTMCECKYSTAYTRFALLPVQAIFVMGILHTIVFEAAYGNLINSCPLAQFKSFWWYIILHLLYPYRL